MLFFRGVVMLMEGRTERELGIAKGMCMYI